LNLCKSFNYVVSEFNCRVPRGLSTHGHSGSRTWSPPTDVTGHAHSRHGAPLLLLQTLTGRVGGARHYREVTIIQ